MKKLGFIAMTTLAICSLAVPFASARGEKTGKAKTRTAEEQIKALQAETVQADLKANTDFLERYYTDDILIIHGIGTASTRAEEFADLKSGSLKYDSIVVREQKIRIYGNTAVVNTIRAAKGVINSKPFSGEWRVTYVWVKLNGNWKLVSRQFTKLPSNV
jgi:ketosteroid isomerase-like protein